MNDRTHDDANAKVRAIIDDAIAELLLLVTAGRDDAAALMAIQSIIRIDDPNKVAEIGKFIDSLSE